MRKIILALILFQFFISCKKETAQPTGKLSATSKLKVAIDVPKSDMDFDLIGMVRYDNIITLKVAHGGSCDPNANFKLYLLENAEQQCTSETLYLVFKTNDFCKSLVTSEINFDLNEYKFCSKNLIIKGGAKDLEITI